MGKRLQLLKQCLLLISLGAVLSGSAAADFIAIDPAHESGAFRAYVEAGLSTLSRSEKDLAKETLRSIEAGRVRIGDIVDLTAADFRRVLHDYDLSGDSLPLSASDWPDLRRPGSRAAKGLRKNLEGYQWENRIYVSGGRSPRVLAATLIHEVNHVLNRSHVRYYEDHRQALIEEYRAFWVEALFRGSQVDDPGFCRRLKLRIAGLYSLKDVDPDSIPDHPPGKLLPSERAWR